MKKLLFVAAVCAASVAHAANVLTFTDLNLGTSVLPGALALSGVCGTCTQTSDANAFHNAYLGGNWDLLIVATQNFGPSSYPNVFGDLASHITGGGAAIGQNWLTSESVFAALFEASQTGEVNQTKISTDADQVFAGLGATASLFNPGWGVYTTTLGTLGGGSALGTLGSGAAVVRGNGGRTYFNSFLLDTFATQSQGERLVANEINLALGCGAPVPEPSTMAFGAAGLLALVFRRMRS